MNAVPYRSLFETALDGMLIINAKTGRIMEVNPALCELAGCRADELCGKKLWEILPLQATDAGLVVFHELQKQKRIYYDDLPFETRDRGRITVELTCTTHDTDRTKIIHCTVRDVTKYQKVKQELWDAEARFKALFRQAGIGIALLEREGRFLDGNARLCEMLGYAAKDLRTLACGDIVSRDEQGAQPPFLQGLLSGEGEYTHAALRCVRKDGATFWSLMTATAIRSPGGASPFFILTLQDITERKRAEEAVVDSRNFFRSLINELPNPIRISDTDAKCDYVNKTWIEFTSRQFDQEIGDGWTEGIHPDDRERVGENRSVSFRNRAPYVTEYR
ncbi:MAG TPA: PAS domain S-box protein, partial [Nitrospirota bacterium]|nr:PAS domain S-box protein [Nitrospirota bacterium]